MLRLPARSGLARLAQAGAGLALLLALASCAGPDSGVITEKDSDPASTYVYMQPAGKSYIPITQYRPPSWQFLLEDGDGRGWVEVSEATWNAYAVGDYYERKPR